MTSMIPLDPEHGRLLLRTFREGLAAQVGHDLTLVVERWSARVTPPQGADSAVVEARVELGSLSVLGGTGGVKPLTDQDRKQILANARKALDSDHLPEASFRSIDFSPTADGGLLDGSLTLHGVDSPLRLTITRRDDGGLRAEATVRQTDYGIKPYSGFFGTLRVRDSVEFELTIDGTALPPGLDYTERSAPTA